MPVSPVIFHNHFENTVSPYGWSGTSISAGCALAVNTQRPHHGAYNLYATAGAGLASAVFTIVYYGSLGGSLHDHWFCRAMNVIIDQNPSGVGYEPVIWFAIDPTANAVCQFGFGLDAGTLKFMIRYRSAGAFANAFGSQAFLNTPYCIEAEILQSTTDNADGLARLWVDGKLNIEVLNLDNDDRAIDYVTFGLVSVNLPNATNDNHMWGDCFVLSKMRIGCERAVRALRSRGGDKRLGSKLFSTVRSGTRMGLH